MAHMRSKMTIMAIVLGLILVAIAIVVIIFMALGPWVGLAVVLAIAAVKLLLYTLVIQPWQHRWGAMDEEVTRTMPGDDLIPGEKRTTRAITIRAEPTKIWPWLIQIGYGRAGWYSYDWIDNDGRPSADRILPELQDLRIGDEITMIPGMGPKVRAMEPNEWLLSGDQEMGTWCLALYPLNDGTTRLVSRWRQDWPITPATFLWIAITDPGAFIMERKMLKGIQSRVERASINAGNGERERSMR